MSLHEHCRQHVGDLYLEEECYHLYDDPVDWILPRVRNMFPSVIHYKSDYHTRSIDYERARTDKDYRYSIIYQTAWEQSDKRLIIMHNDVTLMAEEIPVMQDMIDGYVGIGEVGQCWACPVSKQYFEGPCSPDKHEEVQVTREELIAASEKVGHKIPGFRLMKYPNLLSPLPAECRLNEFFCLIDLPKVKHESQYYFGDAYYDIGVMWFRDMRSKGHRFKHYMPNRHHYAGITHAITEEDYWAREAVAKDEVESLTKRLF